MTRQTASRLCAISRLSNRRDTAGRRADVSRRPAFEQSEFQGQGGTSAPVHSVRAMHRRFPPRLRGGYESTLPVGRLPVVRPGRPGLRVRDADGLGVENTRMRICHPSFSLASRAGVAAPGRGATCGRRCPAAHRGRDRLGTRRPVCGSRARVRAPPGRTMGSGPLGRSLRHRQRVRDDLRRPGPSHQRECIAGSLFACQPRRTREVPSGFGLARGPANRDGNGGARAGGFPLELLARTVSS